MAGCSGSPCSAPPLTTVLCGSLAAMYTRGNVAGSLKDNGAQSAPRASRSFVRSALIAAQVAFSYVLLIGAGLMVNSLIQLQRVDPGFVPQRVFAVGIDLNFTRYPDPQSQRMAAKRLLERVQPLPGVLSAAVSSSFPMDADNVGGGRPLRFRVFGDNRPETEMPPVQSVRRVTPDYFRTVGIPLIAGRAFRESDTEDCADGRPGEPFAGAAHLEERRRGRQTHHLRWRAFPGDCRRGGRRARVRPAGRRARCSCTVPWRRLPSPATFWCARRRTRSC